MHGIKHGSGSSVINSKIAGRRIVRIETSSGMVVNEMLLRRCG
jgi:hypothetical protein